MTSLHKSVAVFKADRRLSYQGLRSKFRFIVPGYITQLGWRARTHTLYLTLCGAIHGSHHAKDHNPDTRYWTGFIS